MAPFRTSAATRSCTHSQTGFRRSLRGRFASQEAIKDLGTNGGGFFNANAAHPFENPNGFTNALEIFACLLIPFSLAITFGRWLVKFKQGIALAAVMGVILIGALGRRLAGAAGQVPALVGKWRDGGCGPRVAGGKLEGQGLRFGS